jgi:hypothetical protein
MTLFLMLCSRGTSPYYYQQGMFVTHLEQLKLHWRIWASLIKVAQGAVDTVHTGPRVQPEDRKVERSGSSDGHDG